MIDPETSRRAGRHVPAWQGWLGVLARLVLGLALLVAGFTKIGNLDGNVLSVRAYHFDFLPYSVVKAIGYAQPVLEIVVGLLVLAGLFTRVSAAIGTLLMLVFIVAIASVWARGLKIDCGCFSQGGATDNPHYLREILRDVVFAAAGVWLVLRGGGRWALDTWLFRPATTSHLDEFEDDHTTIDEVHPVGEDTTR